VAVLFIDLDNFKTVNDSLGHGAGDEVLVAVAERLAAVVRAKDTVARHGGDEFAVLVEDVHETDAAEVADAVRASLRQPLTVGGRELVLSASVGIAFGTPGIDADQLLRNADLAMHEAKRLGKDRSRVFETSMHRAAVERLDIEAELRRALETGELAVHYQPVVVLGTGSITGVEALVRWEHPERGVLSPDRFIPLAEETGLVSELGRQVLERACADVASWQGRHRVPLSVSVNLSPRQLQDDRLLDIVSGALATSGLPATSLVLEVTEGAMMVDSEAAIARLHSLKGLGIRIAVDDFGTGYSSLSYLQRFPIDVLKIDRSFVSSIESSEDSSSLVRTIISLAATLRLQAVAEGIETAAQRDLLAALGCDLAQGYYFAKPMDAMSLEAMLAAGPPPAVGQRRSIDR
jgi:diguanylate cyclase (GGDEF)-like protein